MILFSEFKRRQREEVRALRRLLDDVLPEGLYTSRELTGVILTGSVARGDARIGPFGVLIDLLLVLPPQGQVELNDLFGEDAEPDLPFHCVRLNERVGLQIQVATLPELRDAAQRADAAAFALSEAEVLVDPTGVLQELCSSLSRVPETELESAAMEAFFRFDYLVNDYRYEKWSHREAWTQIAQNMNEATECYCRFLYALNGSRTPRRDWLAYLTYELPVTPATHARIMERLYSSELSPESLRHKRAVYMELYAWMTSQCRTRGWLERPE